MPRPILNCSLSKMAWSARPIGFALALLCSALSGAAQNTPLLSGGVGFLTNTNAGNTSYTPIIEPLLAAPIGQHILIESRAALTTVASPVYGPEIMIGRVTSNGITLTLPVALSVESTILARPTLALARLSKIR